MFCFRARPKLSPYLDGELPSQVQSRLEHHLAGCERCRHHLAGLQQASRVAALHADKMPPAELWERIEMQLRSPASQIPFRKETRNGRRYLIAAAVSAATLVVTLSLLYYLLDRRGNSLVPTAYALDVGMYLDAVTKGEGLLEEFRQRYRAEAVSVEEAAAHVAFPFVAPPELPGGYELTGAHLLQNACCKAAQVEYRRADGLVCLFEQMKGHPVYFGERIAGTVEVADLSCRLVVERAFSVLSCDDGGLNVTVIGPTGRADLMEIARAVLAR